MENTQVKNKIKFITRLSEITRNALITVVNMQSDKEKKNKDVIIEGIRFTPDMLADVSVDKDELLSDPYDGGVSGEQAFSSHEGPLNQKTLSILIRIIGLVLLASAFFLFDSSPLRIAVGVVFMALLAESIIHILKKDTAKRSSVGISEDVLLKIVEYALLIAVGLIAVYFLIRIISQYIIWVILIIVLISWLKDK